MAKPSAVTVTSGSTPKPYTDVTVPMKPYTVRITWPTGRRVFSADRPPLAHDHRQHRHEAHDAAEHHDFQHREVHRQRLHQRGPQREDGRGGEDIKDRVSSCRAQVGGGEAQGGRFHCRQPTPAPAAPPPRRAPPACAARANPRCRTKASIGALSASTWPTISRRPRARAQSISRRMRWLATPCPFMSACTMTANSPDSVRPRTPGARRRPSRRSPRAPRRRPFRGRSRSA